MKRTSIEPNVPNSKPLPKKETYLDEEKNDANKNTTGIAAAARIILSFGIENLPSPSLAMSQKKRAKVAPVDIRKPLLASNVTGTKGIKKNNESIKVTNNIENDSLLKNSTFFDSII